METVVGGDVTTVDLVGEGIDEESDVVSVGIELVEFVGTGVGRISIAAINRDMMSPMPAKSPKITLALLQPLILSDVASVTVAPISAVSIDPAIPIKATSTVSEIILIPL